MAHARKSLQLAITGALPMVPLLQQCHGPHVPGTAITWAWEWPSGVTCYGDISWGIPEVHGEERRQDETRQDKMKKTEDEGKEKQTEKMKRKRAEMRPEKMRKEKIKKSGNEEKTK